MPRTATGSPGGLASIASAATGAEYARFARAVRENVEALLAAWLGARVAEAKLRGDHVGSVAAAMSDLALRGGKRLRPVLLAASVEACGGDGVGPEAALAGVALELLQAYFLAHDDWMDGDDLRRGGPSMPAMMRVLFSPARADAMTVLGGDLAAAWARRAIAELAVHPTRVVLASLELARVEEEVVSGQILDVCEASRSPLDVERMHGLKTSSYSVRGPVVLGARLAGASDDVVAALAAFGQPLGVAFQLRDDLLGVFGDPSSTGKPAASDLRCGKRSSVVVDALAAVRASRTLEEVLGHADASEAALRDAVASIETCGTVSRIEARIGELSRESESALDRAAITPRGRLLLEHAARDLTHRRC